MKKIHKIRNESNFLVNSSDCFLHRFNLSTTLVSYFTVILPILRLVFVEQLGLPLHHLLRHFLHPDPHQNMYQPSTHQRGCHLCGTFHWGKSRYMWYRYCPEWSLFSFPWLENLAQYLCHDGAFLAQLFIVYT